MTRASNEFWAANPLGDDLDAEEHAARAVIRWFCEEVAECNRRYIGEDFVLNVGNEKAIEDAFNLSAAYEDTRDRILEDQQ